MITIKPFSDSDCTARVQSINSQPVANGILIDIPADLSRTIEWAQGLTKKTDRRDFTLFKSDEAIGFGGIVNINQKNGIGELYIFLSPHHAGQGAGSIFLKFLLDYAKIEKNLRKITLYVSSNNPRALKFYNNAGFQQEGLLRNHVWHRGEYVDRHILSVFLDNRPINMDDFYKIIEGERR